MLYSFCYLFLSFLLYSFIGYFSECIYCSIEHKKVVMNRGFFMGPYLPIYGVSCILMNICLGKYESDLLALFVMSVVLCSIVEFFTSYILEKIFKVRWWDYSHMKFNLDGRVCLLNSLLFGIGGICLVYIINPLLFKLLDLFPRLILIIISLILLVVFISDMVISIMTLCKIEISSKKYKRKDNTSEIKVLMNNSLRKNSFFITRLLNAFPHMSGKNLKEFIHLKKKSNDFRKRVKENKEKFRKEYQKLKQERNKKR